jgi:translation initiation factor 2B subunit (eIF-2B alpha/beta/delta family)
MSDIARFNRQVNHIKNDLLSGSATLVNNYIETVNTLLWAEYTSSAEILIALENSVRQLQGLGRQFPVLHHFLGFLQKNITQKPIVANLKQVVRDYQNEWSDVNHRIALQAERIIDWPNKTILVHSNSSTVTEFFKTIVNKGRLPAIIQTESRPNYEGRVQARDLAAIGYEVTLIADAAVGHYLNRVDCAVLGADAIAEQYFVNKIGSYLLTLACAERKKPVYVLTDSRKQVAKTALPTVQQQDPEAIWARAPQRVTPENYCFEITPVNLVTQIIDER